MSNLGAQLSIILRVFKIQIVKCKTLQRKIILKYVRSLSKIYKLLNCGNLIFLVIARILKIETITPVKVLNTQSIEILYFGTF